MALFAEERSLKRNLVIGALGLIVVAALILGIVMSTGGPNLQDSHSYLFECIECGQEQALASKDLAALSPQYPLAFEGAPMIMDCGKCGKTHCVYPACKCRNCGEVFVPKYARYALELGRGERVDISNDACPKCGAPL